MQEARSFCTVFIGLTELLNVFKVFSSHLLLALISEETSTTFPLWKLDYNQKSEVTSNTTWPFDSSKPQRPYNTIPWSETVSSKNPLDSVTYSWTSTVCQISLWRKRFIFPLDLEKSLWLAFFFLGHHMSRSSDKLVEWFWQQNPLFFIFAQLGAWLRVQRLFHEARWSYL